MSALVQDSQEPLEAPNKEALVKRNPHADFPAVQASRPDFAPDQIWKWSKTPNPNWDVGDGANPGSEWKGKEMVHIDPNGEGREVVSNYKIMISSTVPRPIALVSTISKDGTSTNLSPFSYFQNVSQDPPLYSLSFVGGGGICDTVQNLLETGECCISIISDWFIEAANYTSTNTPRGVSEFAIAGLHASPSLVVKPSYVSEAAFSIECKLYSKQEIFSRRTGQRSAVTVLVEAVQWHVRKEAVDEKLETVKIEMLRPVWRAGGITYGTAFSGFELPRPEAFAGVRKEKKLDERGFVKRKVEGQ